MHANKISILTLSKIKNDILDFGLTEFGIWLLQKETEVLVTQVKLTVKMQIKRQKITGYMLNA